MNPSDFQTTVQAMLLGERLSGKGIVATFNGNTNIELWEVEPLLAFGILALVFVGLYPSKTPLVYPLLEEGANAGTFWRAAQRILGRVACLLLAGTIVMELLTGKVGMLQLSGVLVLVQKVKLWLASHCLGPP